MAANRASVPARSTSARSDRSTVPAHSYLHNAHTTSTGAALGAIGLYALWGRPAARGRQGGCR